MTSIKFCGGDGGLICHGGYLFACDEHGEYDSGRFCPNCIAGLRLANRQLAGRNAALARQVQAMDLNDVVSGIANKKSDECIADLERRLRATQEELKQTKDTAAKCAQKAARIEHCQTCGAKVSHYRSGCPICGAPTCCYSCCSRDEMKRQLNTAQRELVLVREEVSAQKLRAESAERERDEARADALNANRTCNDLFDSAGKEITALREQLAAIREHFRPRLQSKEKAPEDAVVLVRGVRGRVWSTCLGQHVADSATWTNVPPGHKARQERE